MLFETKNEILLWHEQEDLLVWYKTFEDDDEEYYFMESFTEQEILKLLGIGENVKAHVVGTLEGIKVHIQANITLLTWFIMEFNVRGTLLRYDLELDGELYRPVPAKDLSTTLGNNHITGKPITKYFATSPTADFYNTHSYQDDTIKSLKEPPTGILQSFFYGLEQTQGENLYKLTLTHVYNLYVECATHLMQRPLDKDTFVEQLKLLYTLDLDLILGDYRLCPKIKHTDKMEEII